MPKSEPLATPTATTWSIEHILRMARTGRLLVPIFQRNFRWERSDVLKLFDSLYRGFPIGNLLIWVTDPTPSTSATFGPIDFKQSETGSGSLIIDGQQRVTSLVATMLATNDQDDARFNIAFDLESLEFRPSSSRQQSHRTWLPLTETADTVRYLEWLRHADLGDTHVRRANEVVRALRDYKVPVYEIVGGAEQEALVREIFSRLNSTGKRLKAPDIFNALHRKDGSPGLVTVEERLSRHDFGALGQRWLMKSVAAVAGLDRERRLTDHFSGLGDAQKTALLERSTRSLAEVVAFLRDECRIPHWSLLPYRFPIGPLAAFFARFESVTPADRRRLKTWLWRGVATGEHRTNSQPMVYAALRHIKHARDATEASHWLHDSGDAPGTGFTVEDGSHNRRTATTKIIGCVLAQIGPLHVETGEPLELAATLNSANPFPQVVVRAGIGSENRILHPSLARGAKSNAVALRRALLRAPSEVHQSHLIGQEAIRALTEGRDGDFLTVRARDIRERANRFVSDLCEFETSP